MIIIFDSKIDKPVIILTKGNQSIFKRLLHEENILLENPLPSAFGLTLDDIKGDSFYQFGSGEDILKLPKNMDMVAIEGNRITIDYVEHKSSAPLHYWKP